MSFDIYGRAPTSEEGKYFCRNNMGWAPIAEYILTVAPDIAAKCKYWDTNDGDGLDAEHAVALADRLDAEIQSGRCEHYARKYASDQEMTPDEPCWLCDGTGTRKPPVLFSRLDDGTPVYSSSEDGVGAGDPKTTGIKCNCCRGEGTIRPWGTQYRLHVESVREFVTFLRGCGGFEIW
jgi:hypothetical protein